MLTDEMKNEGWISHDGGPCPVNGMRAIEIERLRGLVEELADDLEVEVQDRWGYDERLAHKLKRDMDVIVRARAALEARP